jgi:hypothetical protein
MLTRSNTTRSWPLLAFVCGPPKSKQPWDIARLIEPQIATARVAESHTKRGQRWSVICLGMDGQGWHAVHLLLWTVRYSTRQSAGETLTRLCNMPCQASPGFLWRELSGRGSCAGLVTVQSGVHELQYSSSDVTMPLDFWGLIAKCVHAAFDGTVALEPIHHPGPSAFPLFPSTFLHLARSR